MTAGPGAEGALPNLIVIGAPKCGTSSLHYYLDLHPEVSMSSPKELNFFVDHGSGPPGDGPREVGNRVAPPPSPDSDRGLEWYESHFRATSPIRGESSPHYSAPWQPRVAERIEKLLPDVRLVMLVRDPIERALSHYRHRRAAGWERLPPSDVLLRTDSRYAGWSLYSSRLSPFLDRFARERILVVAAEDLRDRRRQTMGEVFRFAGVEPSFWSPKMMRERSPTARKGGWRYHVSRTLMQMPGPQQIASRLPQEAKWFLERFTYGDGDTGVEDGIDPALRERLAERVSADADRLRRLTGRDFAEWSV